MAGIDYKDFEQKKEQIKKQKKKEKKKKSEKRSKSEKHKINVKRLSNLTFIPLDQPRLLKNNKTILSESEEEEEEDIMQLLGVAKNESISGTSGSENEAEETKELSSESSNESESSDSESSEDEGLNFVPRILREDKDNEQHPKINQNQIREENKIISRALKKENRRDGDLHDNEKDPDMVTNTLSITFLFTYE